jgi:hypothetical protein
MAVWQGTTSQQTLIKQYHMAAKSRGRAAFSTVLKDYLISLRLRHCAQEKVWVPDISFHKRLVLLASPPPPTPTTVRTVCTVQYSAAA